MDVRDPAGEFLRITERYHGMSDEELLNLARESSQLTDSAHEALASEMRCRGVKLEPEVPETDRPEPEPIPAHRLQSPSEGAQDDSEEDDPYAEERELVELCEVWSRRDAYQVQWLLDRAGIPFFMGPEKATDVDKVTSNFTKGISVQIMRVGTYWAAQAIEHYEPDDEPPTPPEEKEWKEIPVRCPKCQSSDVVFIDLRGDQCETRPCFRWTCDTCGHRWQDDGTVKE